MKKSVVRQVLEMSGPCISSDLAERIQWQHPSMSPEAIRKMISRSTDILAVSNFGELSKSACTKQTQLTHTRYLP